MDINQLIIYNNHMTVLEIQIPDDLKPFIDDSIETGPFENAGDFLTMLIYNFKARSNARSLANEEDKLAALRIEIAKGVDQADRGIYAELDVETIISEWPARAMARI